MTPSDSRSDLVLRIGGWSTAVGLVFTLIAILPLVVPSLELPGAMWFLSMLTGVGLVVVCVGLILGARGRRSH
ncbi:MAG: hypothetical protein NTX29_07415 [Actinobacteria bacterium]|nr:hypothetical protein [Actinomycetota bacterium]